MGFGIITSDEILENKEDRLKLKGHDKSEPINSENTRETKILERRWENNLISKCLGNFPSEQIFYRLSLNKQYNIETP